MIPYTLEKYKILIQDNPDDKSCRIIWIDGENTRDLAFKKERRKIYIVTFKNEIYYVGEANTSMKIRFQRGCTSYNHYIRNGKARGGYMGYKWLDKEQNPNRNLTIYVAVFTAEFDSPKQRSIIESIEGEIVFMIRHEFGYWPKFQNEIHFSNSSEAIEIAITLLKSLI